MATYIALMNFTDQGIRNVKDSAKRAEAFKEAAKKLGVTVKDIYWTLGQYDIVATVEGPDDPSVTALGLSLGALGNVHTQTLRAFGAAEMKQILDKMALPSPGSTAALSFVKAGAALDRADSSSKEHTSPAAPAAAPSLRSGSPAMADRIITVFGGTGFLGRHVVHHLLGQSLPVRIASRHPERVPSPSGGSALQSIAPISTTKPRLRQPSTALMAW